MTDTTGYDTTHYRAIVGFIAGIGLPVSEAALPPDTFLPGIAVRDGGLVVDPARLRWPGDLLHEAGHLAVLPAGLRATVGEDVGAHAGLEHAGLEQAGPEHAGEPEAMAWAYAAAVALALPLEVLIHDGGYGGKSADLLRMYAFGVYPGLRGLCASGMAAAPGFTPDCGDLHYPQMRHWLRAGD